MAGNRTPLLVILGAAILAALLLTFLPNSGTGDGSLGQDPLSEGSPAPEPERGGSPPILNGTSVREGTPPPSESSSEDPVSLDTLYTEYHPGAPNEWPLFRHVEFGDGDRPDWWVSVVGGMNIFYKMPVPPFLSDVVFSNADRVWLERVRASFDAECRRRTHGLEGLAKLETLDAVSAEYSALLSAVAAKRAGDSPRVQGVFADTTQLRDMEPGSPQSNWLTSMIGLVEHDMMWRFPDLASREDKQYLCAADLRNLKEISMTIHEIVRGKTWEQQKEPGTVSLVRREVEGLTNLIASRR